MPIRTHILVLLFGLGGAAAAGAQEPERATAELIDLDGRRVGSVTLTQTPAAGVHLAIEVSGLAPGEHAIHIHDVGVCEAPFESAGDHFAPRGRQHGLHMAEGMHAGDLLNLHVPADGRLRTERLAPHVTLRAGETNSLFDADGSAIVVHGGADDYRTQPSGGAGDPVACGVVSR